jgi:hypothetical protein
MSSSNKRQQTMAKRAREQAVREKRERKNEKKLASAEERAEASANRALDAGLGETPAADAPAGSEGSASWR